MMGGGAGTPSATSLGGGCVGGMMGGGAGTPSATSLGGGCVGGMMGGGAGTPSAPSLGGGCVGGMMGGGAGTPSAWIVPLFQVGNKREWLTGTVMASRIRLTEIATESV